MCDTSVSHHSHIDLSSHITHTLLYIFAQEQPGDDDSNHTSTASIESRDLGDSQTTKSGRPLLSLRKVQLGSFGFSHSEPAAAVGVAMDDFEMSCDSPVNVCSRTKKARVLDSDDSFSWTNEKKKEEKADGEVDDAEGSSQSLTGGFTGFSLSVCLSVCLCICLSVSLPICLSVC